MSLNKALAAAAMAMCLSSSSALAVTCSGGSNTIYDDVFVNFDPANSTCNISFNPVLDEGYIIGGVNNSTVLGTYVATGQQLNLPDSLFVNGVPGSSNGAGVLVFNATVGNYLAIILATLDGTQYRMEFNGEILGNGSVPSGKSILLSASVTTSTVPVPAALPLLASGLGALGFIGWRRKRKNAAVTA